MLSSSNKTNNNSSKWTWQIVVDYLLMDEAKMENMML
jgi:hypothetical protein